MHRIDADFSGRAHAFDHCLISLDNSKRSFFSVGSTTERKNRLSQRAGYGNLVVDSIERDVVHCSTEK